MMVIVDTSIWSLALRRRPRQISMGQTRQLRRLEELIEEGRARVLGCIRQELVSGIRSAEQFERLRKQLRAFPDVGQEIEDYEVAAEISNACRTHGIAGTPVDFLLCAVAARRNWSIYTADRDFGRYAKHVPVNLF